MTNFMVSVKTRSQEKEIFDMTRPFYDDTVHAYRLIEFVNRYLGGTRVVLNHLKRFSKQWHKPETIRILDVASGAADIPKAIVRWARKHKWRISIVALDASPDALRFSGSDHKAYPEIRFVHASSDRLPFSVGSFDYVITSMFFHHLEDRDVIPTLKTMDALATRGIIVNDLRRHRRAYYGISLLARFFRNKIFSYDAPLSVLRGFKLPEIKAIVRQSQIPYLKYYQHFAFRFAIAGEKNETF